MPEAKGARTARHAAVATGKVAVFVVMSAVAAAMLYEQAGAWRDAAALKQVGRSVDIGGRTLNIHCLGEGTPTVIFASGRAQPGYVWMPTQRRVAGLTRACWYDRAGLGWSDPGPDPSWGDAAARDLRQLVQQAGLHPPFVLVGASFGGYVVRLYHHDNPGGTAGMVFVDTALEDAGTIEGMPHRSPPPMPRGVMRGLSIAFGYLGAVRLSAPAPGPPPGGWTPEEWDVLVRLRRQRHTLLADAQHGPEASTAKLVRAAGGLGDVPMIVLTQGRTPSDPESVDARVQRGWVELQRRFAARSRHGRHIVVPESGHAMAIEAPDVVGQAVREIVTEVRESRE